MAEWHLQLVERANAWEGLGRSKRRMSVVIFRSGLTPDTQATNPFCCCESGLHVLQKYLSRSDPFQVPFTHSIRIGIAPKVNPKTKSFSLHGLESEAARVASLTTWIVSKIQRRRDWSLEEKGLFEMFQYSIDWLLTDLHRMHRGGSLGFFVNGRPTSMFKQRNEQHCTAETAMKRQWLNPWHLKSVRTEHLQHTISPTFMFRARTI